MRLHLALALLAAGALLLLPPWSMPGMLPPEAVPPEQPARTRREVRVSAAVAAVWVFMVMFSKVGEEARQGSSR